MSAKSAMEMFKNMEKQQQQQAAGPPPPKKIDTGASVSVADRRKSLTSSDSAPVLPTPAAQNYSLGRVSSVPSPGRLSTGGRTSNADQHPPPVNSSAATEQHSSSSTTTNTASSADAEPPRLSVAEMRRKLTVDQSAQPIRMGMPPPQVGRRSVMVSAPSNNNNSSSSSGADGEQPAAGAAAADHSSSSHSPSSGAAAGAPAIAVSSADNTGDSAAAGGGSVSSLKANFKNLPIFGAPPGRRTETAPPPAAEPPAATPSGDPAPLSHLARVKGPTNRRPSTRHSTADLPPEVRRLRESLFKQESDAAAAGTDGAAPMDQDGAPAPPECESSSAASAMDIAPSDIPATEPLQPGDGFAAHKQEQSTDAADTAAAPAMATDDAPATATDDTSAAADIPMEE